MPHSKDEIHRIRKAYTVYAGNPEFTVKLEPRQPGYCAGAVGTTSAMTTPVTLMYGA